MPAPPDPVSTAPAEPAPSRRLRRWRVGFGAAAVAALAAIGVSYGGEEAAAPETATASPVEVEPWTLPEEGYDPGAAGFVLQAGPWPVPYRVFALFVEPGQAVPLRPQLGTGRARWQARAEGGTLEPDGDAAWTWTAPQEPGLYPVTVADAESGEAIVLNVFVQVPFDHQTDALDGYAIGAYSEEPLNGNPRFERPEWFVQVTPELEDVYVSPHFTLGQFVAKQASGYPKYLVLQERLLLKLERLLQEVNEAGIEARTFAVLSGYRTPAYNLAIGNTTTSSRHLYGDGADIYVDDDGDGRMDDVTGDGAVTVADAERLAQIVEAAQDEPWYAPFVGGLGIYAPAPHRGPFIHVDTRGEPARW